MAPHSASCAGQERGASAAAIAFAAGCGPGDDPAKLVASAKDFIAKKNPATAVIQLKNALQKEPANAEARYLLGTLLVQSGDISSGEKELRRALEHGYAPAAVVPELAGGRCCSSGRRSSWSTSSAGRSSTTRRRRPRS